MHGCVPTDASATSDGTPFRRRNEAACAVSLGIGDGFPDVSRETAAPFPSRLPPPFRWGACPAPGGVPSPSAFLVHPAQRAVHPSTEAVHAFPSRRGPGSPDGSLPGDLPGTPCEPAAVPPEPAAGAASPEGLPTSSSELAPVAGPRSSPRAPPGSTGRSPEGSPPPRCHGRGRLPPRRASGAALPEDGPGLPPPSPRPSVVDPRPSVVDPDGSAGTSREPPPAGGLPGSPLPLVPLPRRAAPFTGPGRPPRGASQDHPSSGRSAGSTRTDCRLVRVMEAGLAAPFPLRAGCCPPGRP